jgi:hypothetical protein
LDDTSGVSVVDGLSFFETCSSIVLLTILWTILWISSFDGKVVIRLLQSSQLEEEKNF